jgi:endonuclease/exonuclease/phosphatase family metal-dependent hydrolase
LVLSGIHFYRTEEERMRQAGDLAGMIGADTVPVILAGDFNSLPGSPVLKLLEENGWAAPVKVGSPLTFPADGPEREIDFILLRPPGLFRVLDYRVLDEETASDHRPILMVLEVG